jgi:hypothetical protein
MPASKATSCPTRLHTHTDITATAVTTTLLLCQCQSHTLSALPHMLVSGLHCRKQTAIGRKHTQRPCQGHTLPEGHITLHTKSTRQYPTYSNTDKPQKNMTTYRQKLAHHVTAATAPTTHISTQLLPSACYMQTTRLSTDCLAHTNLPQATIILPPLSWRPTGSQVLRKQVEHSIDRVNPPLRNPGSSSSSLAVVPAAAAPAPDTS